MASVPFVRRQREATALGGQQAQRLQTIRLASERHVHDQHVQLSRGAVAFPQPNSDGDKQSLTPVFPHSARASRTIEAVIENRLTADFGASRAVRLRTTIRHARGGIQTERSADERPRSMAPLHAPPTTVIRPATQVVASTKTVGIRQKIVAVRRRDPAASTSSVPRKLTRDELEWIEKQLQFIQRIGLVEKECATWWQHFYASAGATAGDASGDEASMTTMSIQKQLDECDSRRRHETQELLQRLNLLRFNGDNVIHMVHAMRDGTQFATELQEAMDAFEAALSEFRSTQREQFDAYILEEKLLDRDLSAFVQKMEAWEAEDAEKKIHKSNVKIVSRSGSSKKSEATMRLSRGAGESLDVDSNIQRDFAGEEVHKLEQPNAKGGVDHVKRIRLLNNQILQSGGLKGGWDDREHAIFASTLLKCGLTDEIILANQVAHSGSNQEDKINTVHFEGAVAKFLRACIKAVLTKSENAVRSHLDWYVAHLQLVQEKKEVIQQWKQKKETERQQLIQQGLHQVEMNQEKDAHTEFGLDGLQPGEREAAEEERLQRKELAAKDRARKNRQLESWRDEKERRADEKLDQENEMRMQREAREAKKRQELLEKKQQILLYKLQKEEEATVLQRNREPSMASSRSPRTGNDELLLERSRKAIEMARIKRANIQAMEKRRQKQQELPERPKSVTKRRTSGSAFGAGSPTDSEGSPSSKEATLLKPTKAYEARQLTKLELKHKEKVRSRQGAHDAYFPGANVVSDVKIKSFGHIAIAPRAVPTWRRNI